MARHTIPIRVYLIIFGSLITLTAATVWVAFIDLGALNNVAAIGIATAKATLVVLYFMHLRYSDRLNWAYVIGAICFLMILFIILLGDVFTRGWDTAAATLPW